MKIFNRLRNILFDEVTTEIPVITKEDKKQEDRPARTRVQEEPKRRSQPDRRDEVIIERIETPKRERKIEIPDDEPFDMPKLKEEAKKEVKKSTFTFPVFGDDEKEEPTPKRRERKDEAFKERETRREESRREKPRETASIRKTVEEKPARRVDAGGYTNAFDYSYGKYKGDYKTSREQSHEIMAKTLGEKEEHKVFTPSPIISPVYGVLNENYKKEDIVAKKESRKRAEPLDLDSVRRKAYGTLEEEIEVSLSKDLLAEEPQVEPVVPDYDEDDEDGISINDLLVDAGEDIEDDFEVHETVEKYEDDTEIFETIDEVEESIEQDDIPPVTIEEAEKRTNVEDDEISEEDALEEISDFENEGVKTEKSDSSSEEKARDEDDELKVEKTEDKDDVLGEEDLFDLIESIYEGKGEE